TRTHHRMVLLAQSSPGCRSTRPLQIKKATVMLAWPKPITLDAAGRVPQLFCVDGNIKIRSRGRP
ncbi:hypothetical protein, partial [Bradyrhizobium sp. CW4]|uniref:hypothetical protein n=1 Tax=Bradyrhizobium sp. CW4 TaxID=2782687 RepID=UPI001FFAFC12